MKRSIFWIFAALVCLFVQSAFAQQSSPSSRGYLVGPGDVIEGKVLSENDFNFTATVDEDGNFEVPFFDKPVPAVCKTEKELRTEVTRLVAKYVRNPQVSLQVRERKSRPPATVSGEVRTQQQIDMRRQVRLLELITFSGGPTESASGLVQVFRTQKPLCADPSDEEANWKSDGSDVPFKMFSLSSIKSASSEANPIIYPGDLVVVLKAAPIYITGEVKQPQGLYLRERGTSLREAIAQIGGINRTAKTKDIKIYRLKANSRDREIISVNYDLIAKGEQKDVMLEPYDIVEVDKAKEGIATTILKIATGAARTAISGVSSGIGPAVLY